MLRYRTWLLNHLKWTNNFGAISSIPPAMACAWKKGTRSQHKPRCLEKTAVTVFTPTLSFQDNDLDAVTQTRGLYSDNYS